MIGTSLPGTNCPAEAAQPSGCCSMVLSSAAGTLNVHLAHLWALLHLVSRLFALLLKVRSI